MSLLLFYQVEEEEAFGSYGEVSYGEGIYAGETEEAAPPEPLSGTIAQTLSPITQQIEAEVVGFTLEVSGTIGQTLPAITQEVRAGFLIFGQLTQSLSPITQTVQALAGLDIEVTKVWREVAISQGGGVSGVFVAQLWREVALTHDPEVQEPPEMADDTIAPISYPSLEQVGAPPIWVTQRGQDCAAWDFTLDRLVLGPKHVYDSPEDCGIMNGLIRARFVPKGVVAAIDIEAFADDAWRDIGRVYFEDPAGSQGVMQRVRLEHLSPDMCRAVVEARDCGPIHITLKRGERMFRTTQGSFIEPKQVRERMVRWDIAASGGLSNGRIVGATTAQGLIPGLVVLEDNYAQITGGVFGVKDNIEFMEVGIFVARSSGDNDQPVDHHKQFSSDFEQQVRVR